MKKQGIHIFLSVFVFLTLTIVDMYAYADITCNPTTVTNIKNDYRTGNTYISLDDGTVIKMLTSEPGYRTNLAIALTAKASDRQVQVITLGSVCGTIIYEDFNYFVLL